MFGLGDILLRIIRKIDHSDALRMDGQNHESFIKDIRTKGSKYSCREKI